MTRIVIGTTPTITYTFKVVPVNSIVTADLTIRQRTGIVLEKHLSDATVGENTLSWTLTQEETLSLGMQVGTIMVNWLTADGVAGVSEMAMVSGADNHRREVLT